MYFSIFITQRKYGNFSPQDAFKLFDLMFKTILCFASDIRCYEYIHTIENVHINIYKSCLNQNTADFFALWEYGIKFKTEMQKYKITKAIQMAEIHGLLRYNIYFMNMVLGLCGYLME